MEALKFFFCLSVNFYHAKVLASSSVYELSSELDTFSISLNNGIQSTASYSDYSSLSVISASSSNLELIASTTSVESSQSSSPTVTSSTAMTRETSTTGDKSPYDFTTEMTTDMTSEFNETTIWDVTTEMALSTTSDTTEEMTTGDETTVRLINTTTPNYTPPPWIPKHGPTCYKCLTGDKGCSDKQTSKSPTLMCALGETCWINLYVEGSKRTYSRGCQAGKCTISTYQESCNLDAKPQHCARCCHYNLCNEALLDGPNNGNESLTFTITTMHFIVVIFYFAW